MKFRNILRRLAQKADLPTHILYLVNAWLIAAAFEFLLLTGDDRSLKVLSGIAAMKPLRMAAVGICAYLVQFFLSGHAVFRKIRRWILPCVFALYAACTVCCAFSWAFLAICILILGAMVAFACKGWDNSAVAQPIERPDEKRLWMLPTAALALAFFGAVSAWTVARVRCLWTPTFDFGIFAQMFHYMKTTGIPFTTVERDGLLSHFAVHMSPIYYVMLPFYCIVPRPETLQVLQASVLASSVIPLWKLGKQHGLHPGMRTALCALLLLYPAFAGGTSYDIHENCFLTPLILWLLYGIDRKNIPLTAVFALLTLLVKEDAAVYVAIIGVYLLLRSLLHKEKWGILAGGAVLAGAIAYFLAVTHYLATQGDGVMNYRYSNFMYDGSDSLFTVIKAVILCPMKAVFECVDTEKLAFIGLTMLPLLGIPLLTRRYERLVLLIPYVLINLMSDYTYQHSILFQYTFGSTACLIYLTLVNLADIKDRKKYAATALAVCIAAGCFWANIIPLMKNSVTTASEYREYYDEQIEYLETIPDDAYVAATTFYTTYLSDHDILYDVGYTAPERILQCDYVVIKTGSSFVSYAGGTWRGEESFVKWLTSHGFTLYSELGTVAQIYIKQA